MHLSPGAIEVAVYTVRIPDDAIDVPHAATVALYFMHYNFARV
jgi:hypothetical protein